MRTLIKYILPICLLIVGFCSCSEDSKDPEEIIKESPRYYVKYIISTQYVEAEGEFRNDKGEIVYFSGNGEYIFGPVEKGFKAYMNVTKCNRKTVGQLLVSMYEEPFALKASKETYGEQFQLSYTIE